MNKPLSDLQVLTALLEVPRAIQSNGLTERQRHIFYLRFVRDMELSEIAVATGMKINAIKSHLHRALGTVRLRIGTA